MIELGAATIDDMVLAFVTAEVDSSRFGAGYRQFLANSGLSRTDLIDEPDLRNAGQNAARAQMLSACRGYPDRDHFAGFPPDIQWRRGELEAEDLARLRYANYPEWTALSGGTGRVIDAVDKVDASADETRVTTIRGIAERFRAGEQFADLIAIHDDEYFVIVEGHARATAYAIVRPAFGLRLLVGYSPSLRQWALHPGAKTGPLSTFRAAMSELM